MRFRSKAWRSSIQLSISPSTSACSAIAAALGDTPRRQLAGGSGLAQQPLEALARLRAHLQVALADGVELAHVFDLVRGDGHHALQPRVAGDLAQDVEQQIAQAPHRVGRIVGGRLQPMLLEGQHGAVHHRVVQVGLVAEVPVDRAARHAGSLGHFLQGCARHAALLEHRLGGIEQRMARLLGFLLGAADHGGGAFDRPVTYVCECMFILQSAARGSCAA